MNFVAYHDRTSADHQAHFDDLFVRGFRMISLSVYGNRGDERYAAIWVERSGPDWSAVHGVNGASYQTGDISMVLCWNRSDITEGSNDGWWYPDFPALLNAARAHTWSTTDLFPTFGMPSFEARSAGCLSVFFPFRRRAIGERTEAANTAVRPRR
jgi:hypothetical protein